jgi:tetratricopeptide (TPR) repeat protein
MSKDVFRRPVFHLVLIALLGLLVYSNTFDVPFVFDDEPNIIENHYIRDLSNFLAEPSREGVDSSTYDLLARRIAGYFTFALNYRAHGFDVRGYHAVNMAIHILTALLVYTLVKLTFRVPFMESSTLKEKAGYVALFSGLLFICHPVQTQAVTYIVQRFASLAAMFYLLCIVLYVKWRLWSTVRSSEFGVRRRHGHIYLLSLLSCVLAMKTKETAFTLPLAVLVYEVMFFRGKTKWRLLYLTPFFLTMLIIPLNIVDAGRSLGEMISEVGETTRLLTEISRLEYVFTEFRVVTNYIRLLFLPVNQNLDYDYPLYRSFFELPVLLSFLFLLSILGFGIYLLYRSRVTRHALRVPAFGVFWFFLTLSVESSVIPIVDVIFEHRVYLPSMGALIAMVSGAFLFANRLSDKGRRAALVVSIAVVLALSGAAYARNAVWGSEVSLWEDVVRKSPQKARAHSNLGKAYNGAGMTDKAIAHLLTAIRLDPELYIAHNALGNAYSAKGLTDRAIGQYKICLRLKPDFAIAHNNLGHVYQYKGMLDKAIEHYRTATELKPSDPTSYYNLGNVYQSRGLMDNAIQLYHIALKVAPNYAEVHSNLGVAYLSKGMADKAIEHYLTALELKPDCAEAHFNLGLVYFQQGLTKKARGEFLEALRIDPGYSKARESLDRLDEKQQM